MAVCQERGDGYSIGMNTFQGVRVYDSGSQQWTTPDAYAGEVSDPTSQQRYVWNGNNPEAYSDPSGYATWDGFNLDGVPDLDIAESPDQGDSSGQIMLQLATPQEQYTLEQINFENQVTGAFTSYLMMFGVPGPEGEIAESGSYVIGKLHDLNQLGAGEQSLLDLLPNLGDFQANWYLNSGVLRQVMKLGVPIRDATGWDEAIESSWIIPDSSALRGICSGTAGGALTLLRRHGIHPVGHGEACLL